MPARFSRLRFSAIFVSISFIMETESGAQSDPLIDALFSAGAHFGYRRSKRHPTAAPFIFGAKGTVEIFDLEKTHTALAAAEEFVRELGKRNRVLLFVGGKSEASMAVRAGAERIGMPSVSGRWIGGTLTNFAQIRARVERMLDLIAQRERGELAKYTKKEALLIGREITRLQALFGGITLLPQLPDALFVVDPRKEHTAVTEARKKNIPVVALANTDCDFTALTYPIPGNDAARASIAFFVERIAAAYESGKSQATISALSNQPALV